MIIDLIIGWTGPCRVGRVNTGMSVAGQQMGRKKEEAVGVLPSSGRLKGREARTLTAPRGRLVAQA